MSIGFDIAATDQPQCNTNWGGGNDFEPVYDKRKKRNLNIGK